MPKTDYQPGRIGDLIRYFAEKMNVPPFVLASEVYKEFPALEDHTKCANCGASMAEYQFRFDCLDAVLLLEMAKVVRTQMVGVERMDFTDANKVHVPTLGASLAIRCRTTQCSKLGLIAKYIGEGNKQVPGVWVITTRGWAALRGEPVPASVTVFRNEIQERTDEYVTITEALSANREKVEAAMARGAVAPTDYRYILSEYDPNMWVDIAKYGQGALL